MKERLLRLPIRHPWLTILLCLTLIVAAAVDMKALVFRGDYRIFFKDEFPQLVALEEIEKTFNKNDNLVIVVAPDTKDVFTPKSLALIVDLTERCWQIPFSTRVDSISNFQYSVASDDELQVGDLIPEDATLDDASIQSIRKIALTEPVLVKQLVDQDGHVALINVTVQLREASMTQDQMAIVDYASKLVDEMKAKYPGHQFYISGRVAMNTAFASLARQDMKTLIPAMFLAIVLIIGLLFRSFSSTFITLTIIVSSIFATLGLTGWFGIYLSTATVNVPTIVMTLAVADCVHIIAGVMNAMSEGKRKSEAIFESLNINFVPVFITSATTAIGFLTLNFSDVPVFNHLGNLTALGVTIAFALSVTLMPALLQVMPIKSRAATSDRDIFARLALFIIRNRRVVSVSSLIVIAGSIYFYSFNTLNDVVTEYFSEDTDFRKSTEFMEDNISGMIMVNYGLYSGRKNGVSDPQFIAEVERFSEWLRQQPEVDHVSTIADTYKRLNKNMHGDDDSWYRIPGSPELAAQYLLLYEMSLPFGLDLANQINIDSSATRVVATIKNLGSKQLMKFQSRVSDWARDNLKNIDFKFASSPLMFAYISEQNMKSMVLSFPFALLLISLLLILALRSWKLGMISLIPNVLPAVLGFGIWGVISGEINLALSIVSTMSLGIVVDNSVHLLSKYKMGRNKGLDNAGAVVYAFSQVGKALTITTCVLACGFSILTASSFRVNADMGLITSIILVVALAVAFFVLPVFLVRGAGRAAAVSEPEETSTNPIGLNPAEPDIN